MLNLATNFIIAGTAMGMAWPDGSREMARCRMDSYRSITFDEEAALFGVTDQELPDAVAGVFGRNADLGVEACRRALVLVSGDDDRAEAYSYLGQHLVELGKCDEAAVAYGSSVSIRPAWPPTLIQWSGALECLGKYDEAADVMRQLIGLPMTDRGDHSLLERGNHLRRASALHEAAGRLDDAIELLQASLCIDADSQKSHFALFRLLAGIGQREEATCHLRRALWICGDPACLVVEDSRKGLERDLVEQALAAPWLGEIDEPPVSCCLRCSGTERRW